MDFSAVPGASRRHGCCFISSFEFFLLWSVYSSLTGEIGSFPGLEKKGWRVKQAGKDSNRETF